jgi:predicted transcriptional regulator
MRRGRLEIMRDILSIINKNKNMIKSTPLLRKSGLSSNGFKEYYFALLERKLISEIKDLEENKQIILTEKGLRFLEKYKTMINFIEEFEL